MIEPKRPVRVRTEAEKRRHNIDMKAAHKRHTERARAAKREILARLGLHRLPPVCEYDSDEEGVTDKVKGILPECPFLAQCRALPADSPVLCELSDVEAKIVTFQGLLTDANK